jgi:hypothetical protein
VKKLSVSIHIVSYFYRDVVRWAYQVRHFYNIKKETTWEHLLTIYWQEIKTLQHKYKHCQSSGVQWRCKYLNCDPGKVNSTSLHTLMCLVLKADSLQCLMQLKHFKTWKDNKNINIFWYNTKLIYISNSMQQSFFLETASF